MPAHPSARKRNQGEKHNHQNDQKTLKSLENPPKMPLKMHPKTNQECATIKPFPGPPQTCKTHCHCSRPDRELIKP
jgi:hypothetical protein